jgi:hypothetical protein
MFAGISVEDHVTGEDRRSLGVLAEPVRRSLPASFVDNCPAVTSSQPGPAGRTWVCGLEGELPWVEKS